MLFSGCFSEITYVHCAIVTHEDYLTGDVVMAWSTTSIPRRTLLADVPAGTLAMQAGIGAVFGLDFGLRSFLVQFSIFALRSCAIYVFIYIYILL